MHLRYRIILPLLAISLALAVAPAMAATRKPVPVNAPLKHVIKHATATASVCDLGQPDAAQAFYWFYPSDDYYYTFFDPATCGCANGVGEFTAHWALLWQDQCTINVQVWVIPAVDNGNGCYVPDQATAPPDPTSILCGPTDVVTLDGSAGGLLVHDVPLPPCSCLANGQKAFVLFKIVNSACPLNGDGSLHSPAIVADASPDLCTSYNGFGFGAPLDMVAAFGFPGNTTMWISPNVCCDVTGALPRTWGSVKSLYR